MARITRFNPRYHFERYDESTNLYSSVSTQHYQSQNYPDSDLENNTINTAPRYIRASELQKKKVPYPVSDSERNKPLIDNNEDSYLPEELPYDPRTSGVSGK